MNYTAADSRRPADIEQGADMVLAFPLFSAGLEVPALGTSTVSLLRPDGSEAIAAAVVTLDGDTATLVIGGSVLSDEVLSAGWQILWVLDTAAEAGRVYKQRALLVRQRLYPVISNDSLLGRHPELSALYPEGETSWDKSISGAWDTLNTRLLQTGKRPDLVLSPDGLMEAHLALSLTRAFRTCSTYVAGASRYAELADKYEEQWDSEWNRIQLYIDNGFGLAAEVPLSAEPVVFLAGSGRGGFWSRGRQR